MNIPEWQVEVRNICYDDVDTGKTEEVNVLTLGNPKSNHHIMVEIFPPRTRNEKSQYTIYSNGRLGGAYHYAKTLEEYKTLALDLIKTQVEDCANIVKQYEAVTHEA